MQEAATGFEATGHAQLASACRGIMRRAGVPDAEWGESLKAVVELKSTGAADAATLAAFCKEHLAAYKCPRYIVFAQLPRTSTGKIQKFRLREMAKEA